MKGSICSVCSKNLHSILFEAFKDSKKYTFYFCIHCNLIQIRPLQKLNPRYFYSYSDPTKLAKEKNQQINFLLRLPFGNILLQKYIDACYKNRYHKILTLRSHGRILDVGCGEGSFLKKFPNRKWQITGMEINENLAKKAKGKLKNSLIFSQSVEKVKLPKQSFDIITMWHVFEHMHNPKIVLKRIHELMNPSGYLIIEVPNGNSIYRKIFRENWQLLLLPQHLFFWTKKSITFVLHDAGFQVIEISYTSTLNFSGSSSFANLIRSKGISSSLALLAAFIIFPFTIIVNLFSYSYRDNMIVVAKLKSK